MKMQHTYGIFDDEADHVIDLVRRHASLAQVRGVRCPACGSAMAVEFVEGGIGFHIDCVGNSPHISTYQDIAAPPPWWPKCVTPPTDSTWYWREWHSFDAEGMLTMKVSGWQADGVRGSGQLECAPGDPDYAFWKWVLLQSGRTTELIGEQVVDEMFVTDAVVRLMSGMGRACYLGLDGRVWVGNLAEGELPRVLDDPKDVASCIVRWSRCVGLAELVNALRPTPDGGIVCPHCQGSREMPDWDNDRDDGFRYYCKRWSGVGWVAPAEQSAAADRPRE